MLTRHTQLYIFNSILIPKKYLAYIYTHHQRNLATQEKPYTCTCIQKNVLETCVNGAMQDPFLGIDAELHQFINKLLNNIIRKKLVRWTHGMR